MKTLLFASLLFALPLFAFTAMPASGPAAGGTTVTLHGDFTNGQYVVLFGAIQAQSVTHIDDSTLQAVTPAHLPGVVNVRVFEHDRFKGGEPQFEFTGAVPLEAYERFLLPVFTTPVQGAFGSEFRMELSGVNTGKLPMLLFALEKSCAPLPECILPESEAVVRLEPLDNDLKDERLVGLGNPGTFFYVTKGREKDLSTNLRVYDTSRAAENFGTEIPIVSSDEFRREPFALTGVPRDPRFRSTLRIYAAEPTTVKVTIGNQVSFVTLSGSDGFRFPAYAQLGDVPGGRVVIEPDPNGPAVWGFISVTNNETQHITTITPRP